MSELICCDQVDFAKFTPAGAKYALLDHNRLNSTMFGSAAEVVAVIDHHQAEENDSLYRSADPRVIKVPTGSCASLVADYFSPIYSSTKIPEQLADLLLSAIAIDTKKFKPAKEDGKATAADLQARDWLWPRSTFSQASLSSLSASASGFDGFYKTLSSLKKDVSHLDSIQLLARDYKQSDIGGWQLGISSVPVPLELWLNEKADGEWPKFLDTLREYSDSKKLDVASVLTSALKKKEISGQLASANPGRRLVLLALGDERMTKLLKEQDATLFESAELTLTPFEAPSQESIDRWASNQRACVRIFNVENPAATRKQVTPVLSEWIKTLGPKL